MRDREVVAQLLAVEVLLKLRVGEPVGLTEVLLEREAVGDTLKLPEMVPDKLSVGDDKGVLLTLLQGEADGLGE